MVDAAGGGAEGEGAGPVQTSAAGAGPVQTSAAGRNAGPRPVSSKVGGRSAALAVAGDRTGERRTKVGLSSILQDLDYLSFFNPTESDPNLSKTNGYPCPIRSKSN